jgi:hypothetical protein
MPEVYDREKTAALLKEAGEIAAGLKTEMGEIATQISRVLHGGEEDTEEIDGSVSDAKERGQPQATIPTTASNGVPVGKSSWQFWR